MAVKNCTQLKGAQNYTKWQWGGSATTQLELGANPSNAANLPYVTGVSTQALLNGDVGLPANTAEYYFLSYAITGTPGAGYSFQWEVSNDSGVTWQILGAAITVLAAGFNAAGAAGGNLNVGTLTANAFELVRPHVTAGDGTTSVTVTLVGNSVRG